ncbi:unnamed protein product [Toxocara canis]|uniref:Transmembrane protein 205 n=1 Tax=Toxocara canis TaxID=6265 RepID=A0A183V396_TOXCA|nr:unnamed protein product [Toxocara canis]
MVCGPKCIGFIMGISLWGVIFMLILGGLFYNESVGLLEDLPGEDMNIARSNWTARRENIKQLYHQNALNSWIAGAIHLAIFLAAGLRLCCLR